MHVCSQYIVTQWPEFEVPEIIVRSLSETYHDTALRLKWKSSQSRIMVISYDYPLNRKEK